MKIKNLPPCSNPSSLSSREGCARQTPLGPVTRRDRMLGPAPFSICFPHSPHQRHNPQAVTTPGGMDRESRFDALTFNPTTRRSRAHNHMEGWEL